MILPIDQEWIEVPADPTIVEADRRRARRRLHRALAGVWVWAFGVHAAYALLASPNLLPISDANAYRLLGSHLADGLGYIRPYDLLNGAVRPTAEFPPGFPSLLAVFDLIGLDGLRDQRVAVAGVAALGAVGVVLIARRFFSPTVALLLGLLAGAHPALFQPTAALLAESLYGVGVVAILLAALRLVEEPTWQRALVLGLLGGATTLVRSEGVLLAAALAVPVLFSTIRSAPGAQGRFRLAIALLAGLSLLPCAWALRNLSTFDQPVLVSNNLGSVLAGANCDAAYTGDLAGFWVISDDCFAGFRAIDLAYEDESIIAAGLRREGQVYARANLGELPRVAATRVLRTIQLWEPEQQARLATFEGRRLLTERITGWIAWATYVLALAGIADLVARRRWRWLWLLTIPIGVTVVVSAATYGNPRFRMTAEVPFLLLAALGVAAGMRWRADRRVAGP